MTIEKINEWLDKEYGISYTELQKIHEFLCEDRNKYAESEREKQRRIDKAIEYIDKNILVGYDMLGFNRDIVAGIVVNDLLNILRGENKGGDEDEE